MTTQQKDAIYDMLGKIAEMSAFINDIAELLGEDDLGKDGKTWSIEDFENAIKELQSKANSWISVENRLPEDKTVVQIFDGHKVKNSLFADGIFGMDWHSTAISYNEGAVTHWMPLPKPPTP